MQKSDSFRSLLPVDTLLPYANHWTLSKWQSPFRKGGFCTSRRASYLTKAWESLCSWFQELVNCEQALSKALSPFWWNPLGNWMLSPLAFFFFDNAFFNSLLIVGHIMKELSQYHSTAARVFLLLLLLLFLFFQKMCLYCLKYAHQLGVQLKIE